MNIVLTCGDINGIGMEVLLKALMQCHVPHVKFSLIVNNQTLGEIVNALQIGSLQKDVLQCNQTSIAIIDCIQYAEYQPGIPTADSAKLAIESLTVGLQYAKEQKADAVVTMPISKQALNEQGWHFNGQTDMIASLFPDAHPIMMLFHNAFRVTLATVHNPVCEISSRLTIEQLKKHILGVQRSLQLDFGILSPSIAVLALNPHAGEQGLLGNEELDTIIPAINACKNEGIKCDGPFPADGFFAMHSHTKYDAVIAMYHDQGLIPLKMAAHGHGVNYTANVPIVRTSPDHGTAFDIAGKNIADPESTLQAINAAIMIAENRLKQK